MIVAALSLLAEDPVIMERARCGCQPIPILLTAIPPGGGDMVPAMQAVAEPGRLIDGRYRLQGPARRGAAGGLRLGRDELLQRAVVIREIRAVAAAGLGAPTAPAAAGWAEAGYRWMRREAQAAARLNHPGIVRIFDVAEQTGCCGW